MDDRVVALGAEAGPSEAAMAAFDAGALAFVEHDLTTAIQKLEHCLNLEPELDAAQYLLALAQLRAGATAAGRERLERVAKSAGNAMLRDMARSKLALVDRTADRGSSTAQEGDAADATVR